MIPTPKQDPFHQLTLNIEAARSMPGCWARRLLRNRVLDLVLCMVRLLAELCEQARNGTLPAIAQARGVEQARALPPPGPGALYGWAVVGQVEFVAPTRCAIVPVEQAAECIAVSMGGAWLTHPTGVAGFGRITARFSRADSEKWVFRGGDSHAHFVTI